MIINRNKRFLVRQTGRGIGSVIKNIATSDFVKGNLKTVGRLLLGKAKDIAKNILLPAAKKMALEAGTNLKDVATQKMQSILSQKIKQIQNQKNEPLKKILGTIPTQLQDTGQNIISNLMAGSGFKIIPVRRKHKKITI